MANRKQRAQVAAETLQILAEGRFTSPSGQVVTVDGELASCVSGTRLFSPDELREIASNRPTTEQVVATKFRVVNTSTLVAARDLVQRYGAAKVALLNFASARNPGGGFQSGSQAQEESLARASGLYASINRMGEFYEINRACETSLYTDHLIYSPQVPVFRDELDQLLDASWSVSMITAPAPNAGAVRDNEPANVDQIASVLQRRAECVLATAAHYRQQALVLGAWGCGVFANDPTEVASIFASLLGTSGAYESVFQEIVFAVLDPSGQIIQSFYEHFGSDGVTTQHAT